MPIVIDKVNKDIIISYGDVLNVRFTLKGLTLTDKDELVFSVKKKYYDKEVVLSKPCTGIDTDTNSFYVFCV